MKVSCNPSLLLDWHVADPSLSSCSAFGKCRKPSRRVSKHTNSSPLDYSAISTISWSRSLQQNGEDDQPTAYLSPTCRFEQSRLFFSKSFRFSKVKSLTNSTRSNRRRTLSSTSISTDSRINPVEEVVPIQGFVHKLSVANLPHRRLAPGEAFPHVLQQCRPRSEHRHLVVRQAIQQLRTELLLK